MSVESRSSHFSRGADIAESLMHREEIPDVVFREMAKAGARMVDLKDPEGNIDDFYFLRQGRTPVVYASHQSLADGGVLVTVADRLNRVGNPHVDFNLPLAVTLETGHQSKMSTNFYKAVAPWMEKHRLHPLGVARDKDKEKYGVEDTQSEFSQLLRTVRTDRGIMIFPEGSVESGRRDPVTSNRTGLIKVDNDVMLRIIRSSLRVGKPVAFLPVGINETYRIYDPGLSTKDPKVKIPGEAWRALFKQGIGVRTKLASAVVGRGFTSDEILESGVKLNDSESVNNFLMRKLAALLPEEARGYYR